MAKKKVIEVVQDPGKEKPLRIIADHLREISKAIRIIRRGPLNDRALILLIHQAIPVRGYGRSIGKLDVQAVLDAAENLDRRYLRKVKANG